MKDITIEIEKAIKDYTADVEKGISSVIEKDVAAAVQELKANSPKRSGEYAKGWASQKEGRIGEIKMTIYNKDRPQLTHLLEFGHAKRNGGRVAAIPHIKSVEQRLNEQIVNDIENVIKRGG